MSTKKSVRLSDDAVRLCHLISDHEVNFSRSINVMADRYKYIMEKSLPELSEGETLALCAMYNGHAYHDDTQVEVSAIGAMLHESFEYDPNIAEILNQYSVDVDAFAMRVLKFSAAEKVAILHMVQKFWGEPGLNKKNNTFCIDRR